MKHPSPCPPARSQVNFLNTFFPLFQNLVRASSSLRTKIGKRVQFPRCRATVSEDIAAGHWGFPGKAGGGFERNLRSYSTSQETGANRLHQQSLSRVKEDCMRVLRTVVLITFLSTSLFAADLKIKVVDPHSEAVAGAQISVFPADTSTPAAVVTTSGEGTVSLSGL